MVLKWALIIMKKKFCSIIIMILFISGFFIGCIENSQVNIKYFSTEDIIPKVKQGKMFFNFTIRTNETSEIVRLWIPYPVSNEYQEITDYLIEGNYDYTSIFSESQYGIIIIITFN